MNVRYSFLAQIKFRRAVKRDDVAMADFKMPGAPFTSWLTLAFLLFVVVLMAFDYPNGTYTVATIPLITITLILGWSRTVHAKQAKALCINNPIGG